MYFTNLKSLKEDLTNDRFTESDRFIYLFVYIAFSSIFMEISDYGMAIENPTILDYINSAIIILFDIFGTYFIYKANGGSEGKDFAGKYFSLTWVRGIRGFFLILGLYIIYEIVNEIYLNLPSSISNIIEIIILFVFLLYVYVGTYKDVLEIKKKEEKVVSTNA